MRFQKWQCSDAPERLRVGLVSGDFRVHSVGHFLEGFLTQLDQTRVELVAYSTYHREDDLTRRIRPLFSKWNQLFGTSDEAAANMIYGDGINVLIDLSGHTANNRLPVFAYKPAPVQATWLGFPFTTGVGEIDYIIGDSQAIPLEHEGHFSEQVWRLPDCYLCFSPPAYPLEVSPLPAMTNGYITFGSFNNLAKMTDDVVALWAQVLLKVPRSVLYLKTAQLNDPRTCEKTLQRFALHGVGLDRLVLAGRSPTIQEHLAEYRRVDIALDPFPYPGVTTSVEALWMGVPVLSLLGDRFLSLTAKSIAYYAGLPEWVASGTGEFVQKADEFASDPQRLSVLRAGLRGQVLTSPVFDTHRFARNFEDALWAMWGKRAAVSGNA